MKAVLLSVKPGFAARLLSGHKTAEVRRRFPQLPPNTVVYLYASTPIRAVVGTLRIQAVHSDAPDALWKRFSDALDITEAYFDEYLENRVAASVVELRVDERWHRSVSLEELRGIVRVEAPQSYRYLNPAQEHQLRLTSNLQKHREEPETNQATRIPSDAHPNT